MKPRILFFPFTHITQDQSDAALSFFPAFEYLSVNKDLSEQDQLKTVHEMGRINPVFPSKQEIETIEQTSAQYLDWANIHKGNEKNLKALLSDTPYFTHDTDVSHIKSQLLKDKSSQTTETQTVFWQKSLLFLKMAQLCDAQHDRIDMELKILDKTQDELVRALRGLPDFSLDPLSEHMEKKLTPSDLGDKMTGERIVSWTRYMADKGHLNKNEEVPIFITTSRAVFEYLESNCQDVVNPLDIQQIKVHENKCENQKEWQHQFNKLLMHAIQGNECREEDLPKVEDNCSLCARFKLGLFSGKNIDKFFNIIDRQVPVCLVRLK
ncbi:MAG: hypothetical protein ABIJ59_09150 [Pseudomonadota bacterium]